MSASPGDELGLALRAELRDLVADCGPRGPQYGLVFEMMASGGQIQDLMIESSGLSRTAFISLVSANLSSRRPGNKHER